MAFERNTPWSWCRLMVLGTVLAACAPGQTPDDDTGPSDSAPGVIGPGVVDLTTRDLASAWALTVDPDGAPRHGILWAPQPAEDGLVWFARMSGDAVAASVALTVDAGTVSGTLDETTWTETVSWSLTGTLQDVDTVVGELVHDTETRAFRLDRGQRVSGARVTGVWTTASGGDAIVAAHDQRVLVSRLDEAGDWPAEGRLDGQPVVDDVVGYLEAMPVFGPAGGGEALFHGPDAASFLAVVPTATGGWDATVLARTDTAGPATGLWVGLDRAPIDALGARDPIRIVEHGDALYVHDLGALQRRHLARRGPDDTFADNVSSESWTGQLTGDGQRLVGRLLGESAWYRSYQRTSRPTSGDLTGTFGSLTINRRFATAEPPFHGTAALSFDGSTLVVDDVDEFGDGTTLTATWEGDHFVGAWAPATEPMARSPWSGQWLSDGSMLQGLWDEGEWSFTTLPVRRGDEVQADVVYVQNPASDRVVTLRDAASGETVTLFRDQDRVTHASITTAQGPIDVVVDAQLRPTRIETSMGVVDLVWGAAGAFTATGTSQGGVPTVRQGTVDLSDAALLAFFDDYGLENGVDVSAARAWIGQHPGVVEARVLGGVPFGPRVQQDLSTVVKLTEVTFCFGAMLGSTVGLLGALGVGTAVLAGVGAAAVVCAVVAVGAVLVDALWALLFDDECCTPCGLGCFFHCCSSEATP